MNLVQTSVSSKGQMVLPAKLRARYNISQGTRITLLCDETGFYVRKANDHSSSDLNDVVGMLSRLDALRPSRPESNLSRVEADHTRIAQMLQTDDLRIKQAAAAPASTRKRIASINTVL